MNAFLDTHTLLWSVIQPEKLSKTASSTIENPHNTFTVSAATAWEIATKVRLGKLHGAESLESTLIQSLERLGYSLLPITAEIALMAGRFPATHGDPFDRILAAHAIALDIPVISKDPQLDQFGIRRIW